MTGGTVLPVIALLGGIGSGKSTLARRLQQQRPLVVIDADAIGHRILTDPEITSRLRSRFGEAVFDQEGAVDRSALAARVFGSAGDRQQARADLESIVHPPIRREIVREIEQARTAGQAEAIVLDAAVLLEAGWRNLCDAVVFVDTPEELRLQRVAAGRGWDRETLAAREASQLSVDAKRAAADHIVTNAGTPEVAARQLNRIFDNILHNA